MENKTQLTFKRAFVYMTFCFLLGIGAGLFLLAKYELFRGNAVTSNTCPTCDYSSEPDFTHISATTAHDLADRYVSECQPALTAVIHNDSILDARCIQFSLASLKKYIWNLESSVCGCDSFKNLGIRFYYGKYPDLNTAEANANPDLHDLDKRYSFLHTVFLVPTYRTAEGSDQDFEPLDVTNCQSGNTRKSGSVMSLMNHGNLSPPPFPEKHGMSTVLRGLNY